MTSHNLDNVSNLKNSEEVCAYELLILKLLRDITRARARHFDPGFGEDGAYSCHEHNVQNGVNRIDERCVEGSRGRDVIRKARCSGKLG